MNRHIPPNLLLAGTDCTCHRCADERYRRANSEAWRSINAPRGWRKVAPGMSISPSGDLWFSVGE